MRANELISDQERVFMAVVELEAEEQPGHMHNVARRAGMAVDQTREVIRGLLHEPGLVHEIPGGGSSDLGPEYRTEHRT